MDRYSVVKNGWKLYDVINLKTGAIAYPLVNIEDEALAITLCSQLNAMPEPAPEQSSKWYALCEQLADIPDSKLHDFYRVIALIRQAVAAERSKGRA